MNKNDFFADIIVQEFHILILTQITTTMTVTITVTITTTITVTITTTKQ